MNMIKINPCFRPLLVLTTSLTLLSTPAALGQSSPASGKTKSSSEDSVTLSAFVVSSAKDEGYSSRQTSLSTRSAKDLLEVPSSVIVINQDLLNDLRGPLQTALNYGAAGVSNNQRADEDRTIRGFRSMMGLRNGFNLRSYKKIPTFDIERVEVIKGPLQMVLANSSNGGGVNTITRAPSGTRQTDLNLGVGSRNSYRAALNTTGPLVRKEGIEVDYRLTLGFEQGDSDKVSYSVDQKFIGGALRAKLPNAQIITLDFYHFLDNDYEYFSDFLDNGETGSFQGRSQSLKVAKLHPKSTRSFSVNNPSDTSWKTDSSYVNLGYLSRLFTGDLRLNYSYYTSRDREFLISGVGMQANNTSLTRRVIDAWAEFEDNNLQVDYRVDLEIGGLKLENMVGYDYQKAHAVYQHTLNPLPELDVSSDASAAAIRLADRAYMTSRGKNKMGRVKGGEYNDIGFGNNWSAYIQENIKVLDDRLIGIVGFRYQNGGKSFRGSNSEDSPAVVTSGGAGTSYTVYRHGIIYRPFQNVSIYAQNAENIFIRTGYVRRPGTDGPNDPGELAKNQEGFVKEAGVKFDLNVTSAFDLSGSVVYFSQGLTNVRILTVSPRTGAPFPTLSDDNTEGVEVDLRLRYKTAAGVSDAIATLYSAKGRTGDNRLVNNHIESRPSLFAKHTFTEGAVRNLTVGFGWLGKASKRAGGSYYVNQQATYDLLGRYVFSERLSFQLNVNNLTDQRVIVGIGGSALVQVMEGRNIRLAADYRF